jgi:hypothetical protein
MRELTPLDAELLRKACLRYLAMHHPAGFTPLSLATALPGRGLIDYNPAEESVKSALSLLKDLGLVSSVTSPVGSSVYYRCTGQGKLELEREESE